MSLAHPEAANTMISETFEVFHVQDQVKTEKTLYHYHDFYEIHCTLAGSGDFFLDGHEYTLTPGTILLVHYNDLHRIVKQTSEVFERTYIFVTPKYLALLSTPKSNLQNCFKSFNQKHSRVLQTDTETLRSYLSPLEEPPKNCFGGDILYNQAFLNLMIYLNNLCLSEEDLVQPKETTTSPLIRDLMDYASENLAQDLSLDRVSEAFFADKFYLSREFKRQTGFTFHQYVLKKRLLYSKELLRQTGSSSEIYPQCGFGSYTHFLRSFKKEFNMTPKEFLKADKEQKFVYFDHH